MKRNLLVICASTALLTAGLTSCSDSAGREPDAALWQEDFRAARPQLEVAYTDSSRTAFEILAEEYNLVGQLRAPHLLQNKADGTPWLWFEMEDASGTRYSTRNYRGETRTICIAGDRTIARYIGSTCIWLRIRRIRLRCAAT